MKRACVIIGIVAIAAACGGRTPPRQQAVVLGNVAPDGGARGLAASCPATFAAAEAATTPCDRAKVGCDYPEGSCYCGDPAYCGGAAPPPPPPVPPPAHWQCTAKPPAVRADGCPGTEPSGACTDEGKSCQYGDCCVSVDVCRGGQWQAGPAACPP